MPTEPRPTPPAAGLARWEEDGGTPALPLAFVPPSPDEERSLLLLGAAVVQQWNLLAMPVRRQLFDAALARAGAPELAVVQRLLARFLHVHKDDAPTS
jgi:hypothetical protein